MFKTFLLKENSNSPAISFACWIILSGSPTVFATSIPNECSQIPSDNL